MQLPARGGTAFADGTFDIYSGTVAGTGWSFANSTLTITADGTYTISGSSVTTNRIVVNLGKTVNITLSGLNINVSGVSEAAFDMTGATVNLTLTGSNTLKSSGNEASLVAPNGATTTFSSNLITSLFIHIMR
ncbi:MAG: carbohydrate-binding domain-containing protein [Prevotellaceae bacterium]|jgi:hypothetical protein|nr:carbohydrate-binding domain-containing protein [Prevotellaceae bacterium]